MANEIRIGMALDGERKVEQGLKVVEKQVEKTGDAIEDMGGQATAAGKSTDKVAGDFKGAADEAGHLQREVDELTASYGKLLAKYNESGDETLKKDIGKERRKLNAAKRLLKDSLPDPGEAVDAGMSLGKQLTKGLGEAVDAGGPYVKGALIGVAALAAPGITTVIASAVLAGVGAGGIAAGVALAAQDPRVQAAAGNLGEQLADDFQDATRGFIDPVLRSLEKVSNAGWADKLAPSFDKLAEKVDPLTDGLLGLIDEVIPGLTAAFDAAGPVLDSLADGLPEIGDALGDFFMKISSNPEAAANAMELLIDTITDAIDIAGDFIATMMLIYQGAYDVAEALGVIDDEVVILGKRIGKQGAAGDVKDFTKSTFDAEKQLEDFDAAIARVFNETMSVRDATINYEQALDDMVEQLTSGKRTLDEHTQAGRDNWNAINEVTRGIEENREARVRQGETIAESNEKYDAELEALRKQLIGLGYNKAAVNAYINELKKVPQQAITEVHLKGIKTAIGDLRELAGVLGAVTGYGLINVAASLGKRAMGGPVSAGGTYLVGENGPELLQMGASGGYVHNAGQTAAMMSGASGGSAAPAGMTFAATVREPDSAMGKAMAAFIVPYLQIEVMNQGGDVVAVLGAPQK